MEHFEVMSTFLLAALVGSVVCVTARWAWRYQEQVLRVLGGRPLLHRLSVHITGVLVHEKSAIVGIRTAAGGVATLVVRLGRHPHAAITTLERWRVEGAALDVLREARDRIELRNAATSQTLALALVRTS